MKRFHFTLRPLAVLRAHRELRAREALGLSARVCAERQAVVDGWRAQQAQFASELIAGREASVRAAQEAQSLAGYRMTCAEEAVASEALASAQRDMDQRREEFVAAHRALEVVNRFERRARREHEVACGREEQAAFDEFASRLARRRNVST